MEWVSIMLIGIAANLDNLGVSVAYGLQSTKIPLRSNIIIALIGTMITYFSVSMGSIIGTYIDPHAANIGGGIILFSIGVWTIWTDAKRIVSTKHQLPKEENRNYLQKILEHPEQADTDNNKIISFKESFLLGFALSLNCFGVGIGGGITGVSPFLSSIVVGVMSFCTMMIGIHTGLKLSYSWINQFASSITGLLLLSMGVYEIFM